MTSSVAQWPVRELALLSPVSPEHLISGTWSSFLHFFHSPSHTEAKQHDELLQPLPLMEATSPHHCTAEELAAISSHRGLETAPLLRHCTDPTAKAVRKHRAFLHRLCEEMGHFVPQSPDHGLWVSAGERLPVDLPPWWLVCFLQNKDTP